jgi:hypothetical protein
MGIFQHSTLRRLPGLLAVLAYLGAWGGDVLGFADCPHHEGIVVSGYAVSPLDPGAGHDHGSHDHGGEDAHADHSHGEDHDHGPCVCIGDCVGAATASPPVAGSALFAPVTGDGTAVLPASRDLLARIHLPFVLPYSTAPPAVEIRTHI